MRKGVTLIELMVVIIVLGILATLALPNIKNIAGQARQSAKDTDIATVQSAVDTYRLNSATNSDPIYGEEPGDAQVALIDFSKLTPDYLRAVPNSAQVTLDGTDGGTAIAGAATESISDGVNKSVYVVDKNGTVSVVESGDFALGLK